MSLESKENNIPAEERKNQKMIKKSTMTAISINTHSLFNKALGRRPRLNIIKLSNATLGALKVHNIEYALDSGLVEKLFAYKKCLSKKQSTE